MFIDTHCHLERSRYGDDLPDVLARARAARVSAMVAIGSGGTIETCAEAVDLATAEADVRAAIGVHPHEAASYTDALEAGIEALAADPAVVAIGETGLDYHYSFAPPEVQEAAFRRQIHLAHRVGKPLVIHNRDSDEDCMRILRDSPARDVGGVIHCFTSGWELARVALDLGFFLGFTGIVSFRNAENVRDVLRRTPLDRIVIETDSPFLAPVPYRGKRNEPAFVADVGAAVARVLERDVAEVAALTTANARQLYRLPEAEGDEPST